MKGEKFLIGFVLAIGIFMVLSPFALADNSTNMNSSNSTNLTFKANATSNSTGIISNVSSNITANYTQSNTTGNIEVNSSGNATIDNETEHEIGMMQGTGPGAQIRVLQLERSIEIKILEAQAVLGYVQSKTSNYTSNLQDIINKLQNLKNEAGNVSVTNRTYAVGQFVDIKSQAAILVKEFRGNASAYLNENDRRALQAQFNQIERNSFQDMKKQIENLQKELWREQIQNVLNRFGRDDNKLLDRINQSNMTAEEIRSRLEEDFSNMTQQQRANAQIKLREDAIQIQQQKLDVLKQIEKEREQQINRNLNQLRLIQEREANRSEKINNFIQRFKNKSQDG
jgi:hypothetical protein